MAAMLASAADRLRRQHHRHVPKRGLVRRPIAARRQGERPAIQAVDRFETVINLKTAAKLGITVPPSLSASPMM
jgi:hypothetical protein